MYTLSVDNSMIEDKRYEVRGRLNNKLYNIGSKLQNTNLYSLVEEAIASLFAVRAKLREKHNSYEGLKFANIYAAFISSELTLDKLIESDNISHNNYFFGSHEDFNGLPVDVENRLLTKLSESLGHNGAKSAEEKVTDYFTWLRAEAKEASEVPDVFELTKQAYNIQVKVLNKTFKGFECKREHHSATEQGYSWDNIGGYEDVKKEFQQYCFFLKNANNMFEKYGKSILKRLLPKGILLVGPPGTGKTLFAKTLCYESSIDFYSFDQADVGSSYINKTSKNLRELLNKASEPVKKGYRPASIVFIDELDSIGRKRHEHSDEDAKVVTTLNNHLDGIKEVDNVFFIAATNRADMIDPSLTRSGRFSKKVEIGFPDDNALASIYRVHINKINASIKSGTAFDPHVNLSKVVNASSNKSLVANLPKEYHMNNEICNVGITGSAIEEILNRAFQKKVYATEYYSKEFNPISTQDILFEIELYRRERKK